LQKNKKFSGNAVFVLAMLMILGGTISMSDSGNSQPPDTCSDGIDNDGDGAADSQDFECNPTAPMYDGDEDGSHDQSQGVKE
jgi:hypothetical protein